MKVHHKKNTHLIVLVNAGESPVGIGYSHPQILRLEIKEVPARQPISHVCRRVVECIQVTKVRCSRNKKVTTSHTKSICRYRRENKTPFIYLMELNFFQGIIPISLPETAHIVLLYLSNDLAWHGNQVDFHDIINYSQVPRATVFNLFANSKTL